MKDKLSRTASMISQQAILVLGMHRSGTSALSGTIRRLGAAAPKHLIPADAGNPRGYWESMALMHVHDRLLADIGTSWQDWRPLPGDWLRSQVATDYRERTATILVEEFGDEPLFFIKDPRVCRLVPFTLSVLDYLDIAPAAVLPIRNPLEVARSLQRRDKFPPARSFLIWIRHVLDAEYHSRAIPRSIIQYDDLLDDWRSTLGHAGQAMGIEWPAQGDAVAADVDNFLEGELRHHRATLHDLEQEPGVSTWVLETYRLLRALSEHDRDQDLLAEIDNLRRRFEEGCEAFATNNRDEQPQEQALPPAASELCPTKDMAGLIVEMERLNGQLSATNEGLRGATAEARDRLQALDQIYAEIAERDQIQRAEALQIGQKDNELRDMAADFECRIANSLAAPKELANQE